MEPQFKIKTVTAVGMIPGRLMCQIPEMTYTLRNADALPIKSYPVPPKNSITLLITPVDGDKNNDCIDTRTTVEIEYGA